MGFGLTLGSNNGGIGTYNLMGGSLQAGLEYIGYSGTGTFNQTGGTNTVVNFLALGYQSHRRSALII